MNAQPQTPPAPPNGSDVAVHPVTGEVAPPAGGKLAAALAKAQAKMGHASKDRTNPHFGQKYATLASVVDAIREPFAENGLSHTQDPQTAPDFSSVTVVTTIMHVSGECLSSTLRMPVIQKTPQGLGSAITYARRYALAAMAGVAPDDDDDGNAASTHQNGPAPQKRQAPPEKKSGPPPEPKKETSPAPAAQPGAAATDGKTRVDPVEYMKVKIDTAQDEAELKALVEEITNLPDAAKDAVRPLWAARLETVKKAASK